MVSSPPPMSGAERQRRWRARNRGYDARYNARRRAAADRGAALLRAQRLAQATTTPAPAAPLMPPAPAAMPVLPGPNPLPATPAAAFPLLHPAFGPLAA